MLGRLLKRLFGGRDAARPVSPPPPPVPRTAPAVSAPTPVAAPAPPPPPPAPQVPSAAPVALAEEPETHGAPAASGPPEATVASSSRTITDPGRVRFVLEDGSLAEPEIDPEFEERLKYLVDNIVPPNDPPTT